jgi:uncharacterized protein YciI
MPYFAAIMEIIDPAKDEEILEEHMAYLQHHIDIGNIFAKGPFTDHSGGLIILKTDTFEDAQAVMDHDPVSVNHTRKITLKQWKSTLL